MKIFWSIALIFGIAYAWAGLGYSYFRFRGTETKEKWQRFMERHFDYFVHRVITESPTAVTPSIVRKAGARGWNFLLPPMVLFMDGITPLTLSISTALLLVAGQIFAMSWYGQRCLHCLEIEGY